MALMKQQEWQKLITTPTKSLLALHTKPDGDSIGSNVALAQVLQSHGHQTTIISRDTPPATFSFLPGFDQIEQRDPTTYDFSQYEIFWALDMSAPSMLDESFRPPTSLPIAVIDHHASNSGWGKHNLVVAGAASTTQVVFSLLEDIGQEINSQLATSLYTGLATDTGFMEFITEPEPFRVAARLLECGANADLIRHQITQQTDLEYLKASASILSNTEIVDGTFTLIRISHDRVRQHKLGGPPPLTTEYAGKISGTKFGVVMFESRPNVWRLEFRSHQPGFDVSNLAVSLGGGGHIAAAGVRRIEGTAEEILAKLKQSIPNT